MNADPASPLPRPGRFKTQVDGRGGLVRVLLVGEPHDGRELYIDEHDLPAEIYTTPTAGAFEWWPAGLKEVMDRAPLGGDVAAPPVRYILRIPDDTREPLFVAATEAR